MKGLTDRQREVLEYIRRTIVIEMRPPTVREIADHFGWASPKAASDHLSALERKCHITRGAGSRNIRVPDLEEKVVAALEEHARRFSYPGMEASVERYFVKVEE